MFSNLLPSFKTSDCQLFSCVVLSLSPSLSLPLSCEQNRGVAGSGAGGDNSGLGTPGTRTSSVLPDLLSQASPATPPRHDKSSSEEVSSAAVKLIHVFINRLDISLCVLCVLDSYSSCEFLFFIVICFLTLKRSSSFSFVVRPVHSRETQEKRTKSRAMHYLSVIISVLLPFVGCD